MRVEYWVAVNTPILCKNTQIKGWEHRQITISVPVEASIAGGVDLENALRESSGAAFELDPESLILVDFEVSNDWLHPVKRVRP